MTGGFPLQMTSNVELFPFDGVIMVFRNSKVFTMMIPYFQFTQLILWNDQWFRGISETTFDEIPDAADRCDARDLTLHN